MGLFSRRADNRKDGLHNTGARIEPVSGINLPGVRYNGDGTAVIQHAKRSDQLEKIAESVEHMLPGDGNRQVTLTAHQARQIWGWMQTVGTVAIELRSIGR